MTETDQHYTHATTVGVSDDKDFIAQDGAAIFHIVILQFTHYI